MLMLVSGNCKDDIGNPCPIGLPPLLKLISVTRHILCFFSVECNSLCCVQRKRKVNNVLRLLLSEFRRQFAADISSFKVPQVGLSHA